MADHTARLQNFQNRIRVNGITGLKRAMALSSVLNLYFFWEKKWFFIAMFVGGLMRRIFIESQVEKIRRIKAMIGDRPVELEVDGGITADNVKTVTEAGANVVVAGSAVFNGNDYAATIGALRDAAG